ncbi:MAG TPA: type II secretion system protein [Crinalium sp.]|jgi:prepilin-type N-terminal cleavage/methylation domain-containing protein
MLNNFQVARHLKSKNISSVIRLSSGFTLTEVLAVVSILTIMGAFTVPHWFSYLHTYTLNTAQDQAFQLIRQTQNDAKRLHTLQQVSFRELNGRVQGATHPANRVPTTSEWQNFPEGAHIDIHETTFATNGDTYKLQFDQEGNANGQLGRLVLVHQAGGQTRRCVVVSTLIGLVRKASNRATPDQSGRTCY